MAIEKNVQLSSGLVGSVKSGTGPTSEAERYEEGQQNITDEVM